MNQLRLSSKFSWKISKLYLHQLSAPCCNYSISYLTITKIRVLKQSTTTWFWNWFFIYVIANQQNDTLTASLGFEVLHDNIMCLTFFSIVLQNKENLTFIRTQKILLINIDFELFTPSISSGYILVPVTLFLFIISEEGAVLSSLEMCFTIVIEIYI